MAEISKDDIKEAFIEAMSDDRVKSLFTGRSSPTPTPGCRS